MANRDRPIQVYLDEATWEWVQGQCAGMIPISRWLRRLIEQERGKYEAKVAASSESSPRS